MTSPVKKFWTTRLEELRQQLEGNNFRAFTVESLEEAGDLFMEKIFPDTNARTVSYGGSMTMKGSGVLEKLATDTELEIIRPDEPKITAEEAYERRRQGLLVDLYLTGTNAVTEMGQLVNLDMIGNRVGAIAFGPKHVVLFIGRNKIVPDLESAMARIKDYAAPVNAIRLDFKTPCAKTSFCTECNSPARICNHWTITEKSFPKNRITVILINEDLGF